ncbi:MAG: hypothetical protein WCB67_06665, partial [Solirubrobacteraceae bacterium]
MPAPQIATTVAVPSPSARNNATSTSPSKPATSSTTFANTSPDEASVATNIATRRNAACSSTS